MTVLQKSYGNRWQPDAMSLSGGNPDRGYEDRLLSVANSALKHPALDNAFYARWMEKPLNLEQMSIFCVNYWHWIVPTVDRLAYAFNQITDLEARTDLVQNLNDECGHGVPEKGHTSLLFDWLNGMHIRVVGEPFNPDARSDLILPATRRLTAVSLKLCGEMGAQVASGAVLAQEWHAYTQLVKLHEGYRNYMKIFDFEEFHDKGGYLYIHIGSAEKEHKQQAIRMAVRACKGEDDFVKIQGGFYSFLNLLGDFWLEIDLAMQN